VDKREIANGLTDPGYCCTTGLRKFGSGAEARVCLASDIAGLKPGASTVAALARRSRFCAALCLSLGRVMSWGRGSFPGERRPSGAGVVVHGHPSAEALGFICIAPPACRGRAVRIGSGRVVGGRDRSPVSAAPPGLEWLFMRFPALKRWASSALRLRRVGAEPFGLAQAGLWGGEIIPR
jgi:hypothetical protein